MFCMCRNSVEIRCTGRTSQAAPHIVQIVGDGCDGATFG